MEIEFQTKDGVWTSTTMHHKKVFVEKGQSVFPGQKIAEGKGEGDQFDSPRAGKPHVHWETRRNGEARNPLDGTKLSGGYRPPSGQPISSNVPLQNEQGGSDMFVYASTELRKQAPAIRTMVDPQVQALYQRAERMCEQGPSAGPLQ